MVSALRTVADVVGTGMDASIDVDGTGIDTSKDVVQMLMMKLVWMLH